MNCLKRFIPIITTFGIGITSYIYRENIKTHFKLNQKINFDYPKDYKKRNLEDNISKVLHDGRIQGVYVLYAPPLSGKTTAIKKVIRDMQESGSTSDITIYDWNNNNKTHIETFHLKPFYIDVSKEPIASWFDEFDNNFVETIPKNIRSIIVLDNMSKDVLDGFDEFNYNFDENNSEVKSNSKAKNFYTFHAINSHNTGLKYAFIVVTNDKNYAINILRCNGAAKVHQIDTDYEKKYSLEMEARRINSEIFNEQIKKIKKGDS